MSALHKPARAWIGYWLLGVAALHTVVGALMFHADLFAIVRDGVWDTVGEDPRRAGVVFFLLVGLWFVLQGLAVTALERSGDLPALRQQGYGLLVVSLVSVVLMPSSGFWLFAPAIWTLLRSRRD